MRKLDFKLMALAFKVRDWFLPPSRKLKEAGIEPGFRVLDFGCGPGSYSLAASRMVGKEGKAYALDINPAAIEYAKKAAAKKGLDRLTFIRSGLETGIEAESLDAVLLYDTFHHLADAQGVLRELGRVLKPGGILSVSDHHLKEPGILSGVTAGGGFALAKKGQWTYTFVKKLRPGDEHS
jgi:ubiquinone/menaquinone biosynthesis C-methylase UbiE